MLTSVLKRPEHWGGRIDENKKAQLADWTANNSEREKWGWGAGWLQPEGAGRIPGVQQEAGGSRGFGVGVGAPQKNAHCSQVTSSLSLPAVQASAGDQSLRTEAGDCAEESAHHALRSLELLISVGHHTLPAWCPATPPSLLSLTLPHLPASHHLPGTPLPALFLSVICSSGASHLPGIQKLHTLGRTHLLSSLTRLCKAQRLQTRAGPHCDLPGMGTSLQGMLSGS